MSDDKDKTELLKNLTMEALVVRILRSLNLTASQTHSMPGFLRGIAIALAETIVDDMVVPEGEDFWKTFTTMVESLAQQHREQQQVGDAIAALLGVVAQELDDDAKDEPEPDAAPTAH